MATELAHETGDHTVAFTRMSDGTEAEIHRIIESGSRYFNDRLVDTMMSLVADMKYGPAFGYRVTRYEHVVQTASRALRDGARADVVVAALLHDVADAIAPANHGGVAAAMLEPYVDAETTWVVKHHTIFQGYHYFDKLGMDRNLRDRYRDSPHFDAAVEFCARWDQVSFDPAYESLPLEAFRPVVEDVFTRSTDPFRRDAD